LSIYAGKCLGHVVAPVVANVSPFIREVDMGHSTRTHLTTDRLINADFKLTGYRRSSTDPVSSDHWAVLSGEEPPSYPLSRPPISATTDSTLSTEQDPKHFWIPLENGSKHDPESQRVPSESIGTLAAPTICDPGNVTTPSIVSDIFGQYLLRRESRRLLSG